MKCLFSIIVPVYNIEQYIGKCIESIALQSFTDYEVILVDDGSYDSSSLICKNIEKTDNRFKYVRKNNGGLVSARQYGVKFASGEYVLCVDGDDWLENGCLEEYAKIIKKTKPDVICGQYNETYKDTIIKTTSWKGHYGLYDRSDIEKEILPFLIYDSHGLGFPRCIWAKAYKRELYSLNQLKIDPRIKIGEDIACVAPIVFDSHTLYVTERVVYNYRHNDASMTKTKKPFSWVGPAYIDRHFQDTLDLTKFGLQNQVYCRTTHALFNVAKTQFYGNQSYLLTAREIKKHLSEDDYRVAIKKARFQASLSDIVISISMKHRLVFIFFLMSKYFR